jgi:hypothetical protein
MGAEYTRKRVERRGKLSWERVSTQRHRAPRKGRAVSVLEKLHADSGCRGVPQKKHVLQGQVMKGLLAGLKDQDLILRTGFFKWNNDMISFAIWGKNL